MKKFLTAALVALALLVASPAAAQLPLEWHCYVNESIEEQKLCEVLFEAMDESGFARDRSPEDALWWQVETYVRAHKDGGGVSASIFVTLAYPAKTGQMLIAVDQRLLTLPAETLGKKKVGEAVVTQIILSVGEWSRIMGDFIDFLPFSGVKWFEGPGSGKDELKR